MQNYHFILFYYYLGILGLELKKQGFEAVDYH